MNLNPSEISDLIKSRIQNMQLAATAIQLAHAGRKASAQRPWEGGQPLKPGDQVLVQVSKDPVGHKGARLTTQISLAGRFLVYVPGGSMTGISRKLPDTERQRLKDILKKIVPDDAGVIIRTAAEGASEEELTRDVNRLKAQWEVIEKKAESLGGRIIVGSLKIDGDPEASEVEAWAAEVMRMM